MRGIMKTPEERRAISLRLIQEAKADLSKGNYQEAGQKTWGAVVQHLKVIGENRGWNHASDRLLEDVGWQMRAEYSGHESAALADGLSEA